MEPDEEQRLLAFCGRCAHFELWALAGGADCHRGHDPRARAADETCVDRRLLVAGDGPQFDMSE